MTIRNPTHIPIHFPCFHTSTRESEMNFYFHEIKVLGVFLRHLPNIYYISTKCPGLPALSNRVATSHTWPHKLKFKMIKVLVSHMRPVATLSHNRHRIPPSS